MKFGLISAYEHEAVHIPSVVVEMHRDHRILRVPGNAACVTDMLKIGLAGRQEEYGRWRVEAQPRVDHMIGLIVLDATGQRPIWTTRP